MARAQLRTRMPATVEVALDGVGTDGESPYLWIDRADDLGRRGTNYMFAILEPVGGAEPDEYLAQEALTCLRQELAERRSQAATAALLGAIEATNTWLYDVNSERPSSHRQWFGLTCALARDDELYIAQVLPSQILIGQEGELYAFPGLEVWRWPRRPGDDEPPEQPLGQRTQIEPDLYHTRLDQGDLIVLTSTSLARVIDREPQDVLVEGDAAAAGAHLETLGRRYGLSSAYAAAIAVLEPTSGPSMSHDHSLLRRVGDICTHLLPEETGERIRDRQRRRRIEVDLESQTMHTQVYPEGASAVGTDPGVVSEPADGTDEFPVYELRPEFTDDRLGWDHAANDADDGWDDEPDAYWEPEAGEASFEEPFDDAGPAAARMPVREGRGKLTGLLAGAVLALSAAVVGVWQLTIHRDRSLGEPRDDGTLGLPRLQRYDDRPQLPDLSGVRARLPRAPISKLTAVVALILVLGLAVGLTVSIRNSRARARQAKVEQLLQAEVQQRAKAAQTSDPTVAQAYLLAAEARLREAKASGLDATRANQEEAAIATARDNALHIERLTSIHVLGGVPAAPAGVTPRIFLGNGRLYIFTDALYQLDPSGTKLIRLLGAGDQVGGVAVGTLLGASWADKGPIAFDGSNAYVFDPSKASWARQPLGTFGAGYSGIVASNGFGGNLYFLSPESGQILKFAGGSFNSQPEDWTGGQASNDLKSATDMQIDGHIYVLLKSGAVLNFFMSALQSTTPTKVTPPVQNAVAISEQPDQPYVYIADSGNRILRVKRDSGQVVQQFLAAPGAPQLSGIKDLAVEDANGVAYVLTNNALIQVRLPAPPK